MIYQNYDNEPEEEYLDLSESVYTEFYHLEMENYTDDFPFYEQHLRPHSSVLELGCGTGRLSRLLASNGWEICAIDNSLAMLTCAKTQKVQDHVRYACMDMQQLGFSRTFENIIIPYNTINLLASPLRVSQCLHGCFFNLSPAGKLLLHLHVPSASPQSEKNSRTFQFQIFSYPDGGKLIRETLRSAQPHHRTIHLEERYKIRRHSPTPEKINYRRFISLCALSKDGWLDIIRSAGFTVLAASENLAGSQNGPSFQNTLFVVAQKK